MGLARPRFGTAIAADVSQQGAHDDPDRKAPHAVGSQRFG
jgi:hypothetical protein